MNLSRARFNKECKKWDYRIMATSDSDDVTFEVYKMYYDEQGLEKMYNTTPVSVTGGDASEVASFLQILKAASKRPILWKGDRFPEVYEMTTT